MDDTKKNNLLSSFINLINKNLKILISLSIMILIFFAILQYYFYYKNQNILNSSIHYNKTKLLDSEIDFLSQMNLISKNNNFYSILADLEIINSNFDNKNFEDAYSNYLQIFKNNNLNSNTIKSSIAISSSYRLFEKIDNLKIINLLSFVDDNLIEYNGHKLEILYLIAINENNSTKSNNLFDEIMNDKNISLKIKDRVKSINEYKKYK